MRRREATRRSPRPLRLHEPASYVLRCLASVLVETEPARDQRSVKAAFAPVPLPSTDPAYPLLE